MIKSNSIYKQRQKISRNRFLNHRPSTMRVVGVQKSPVCTIYFLFHDPGKNITQRHYELEKYINHPKRKKLCESHWKLVYCFIGLTLHSCSNCMDPKQVTSSTHSLMILHKLLSNTIIMLKKFTYLYDVMLNIFLWLFTYRLLIHPYYNKT